MQMTSCDCCRPLKILFYSFRVSYDSGLANRFPINNLFILVGQLPDSDVIVGTLHSINTRRCGFLYQCVKPSIMEFPRQPSLEIVEDDAYDLLDDIPVFNFDQSRDSYQPVTRKRPNDDEVRDLSQAPSATSIPCKQSKLSMGTNNNLLLLAQVRNCIMFYLDRCCTDRLFKDNNKWALDGDDVVLTLRICDSCTQGNLDMAMCYHKTVENPSSTTKPYRKSKRLAGLWRLFRLKYTLAIHPCSKCRLRMRQTLKIWKDDNGDTVIIYRMCKGCAEGHMELTQLYNDNFALTKGDD